MHHCVHPSLPSDSACVVVFILDYALKWLHAEHRTLHVLKPLALLDLSVITSHAVMLFWSCDWDSGGRLSGFLPGASCSNTDTVRGSGCRASARVCTCALVPMLVCVRARVCECVCVYTLTRACGLVVHAGDRGPNMVHPGVLAGRVRRGSVFSRAVGTVGASATGISRVAAHLEFRPTSRFSFRGCMLCNDSGATGGAAGSCQQRALPHVSVQQ